MPLSNEYRKKVINYMFRGDAFTPPTTYWLSLHTTSLTTAAPPTSATEVARANGYTRMPVTTGMLTSATTANSTINLTTGVQFPDPTGNWSTVYAIGIHDSSVTSGGSASTLVAFANLQTTVNVTAGNPVRLSSGTTLGLTFGLS